MKRAAWERRQILISAVLAGGILAAALILAGRLRLRFDLTEERSYSLAPATREMLAGLEDRLQIKLYFNREVEGAEALLPARVVLEDLLDEIQIAGGGRVVVETVDPTADLAAAGAAERAGVSAISLPVPGGAGGMSVRQVYQGLEMRYQDRAEVIPFLVPAEFEFAFAVRLANLLRAERPVVGVFSREPPAPPPFPGVELPPDPERVFESLRVLLGQRYELRDVRPAAEEGWSRGVAALIVARPEGVTERELYEIDQYLAGGGHVLLLYDHEKYDPRDLARTPLSTGLDEWLRFHGVRVASPLLWDEENFDFPIQQSVKLPSGQVMSVPRAVPYGLIPVLSGDSVSREHVATAALDKLHFLWAHAVHLGKAGEGVRSEVLAQSSPRCWQLAGDLAVEPSLENIELLHKKATFGQPPARFSLAVALTGAFPSFFAGQADPVPERQPVSAAAPGVLVVVGDSDLFTAVGLGLGQDSGNADFAANLIDWLAQDQDLIGLRGRGKRPRELRNFFKESVEEQGGIGSTSTPEEIAAVESVAKKAQRGQRRWIAWTNVLVPPLLIALGGAAHVLFWRARARRPYRPRGTERP